MSLLCVKAVRNHRRFDDPVVPDSQPQDAALENELGSSRPPLVVADVEVPVGSEGDAHGKRVSGLLKNRYIDPLPDVPALIDFQKTAWFGEVGEIRAGKYEVAFGIDGHSVRCARVLRQFREELGFLHCGRHLSQIGSGGAEAIHRRPVESENPR